MHELWFVLSIYTFFILFSKKVRSNEFSKFFIFIHILEKFEDRFGTTLSKSESLFCLKFDISLFYCVST